MSCVLLSDSSKTELIDYKLSKPDDILHLPFDDILYKMFGEPYNVTSGYCHKPNKANLKDEDQNSNDIWTASEKGKGHDP